MMGRNREDGCAPVAEQHVHPWFKRVHVAGIEQQGVRFRTHVEIVGGLVDIDQSRGERELTTRRLSRHDETIGSRRSAAAFARIHRMAERASLTDSMGETPGFG